MDLATHHLTVGPNQILIFFNDYNNRIASWMISFQKKIFFYSLPGVDFKYVRTHVLCKNSLQWITFLESQIIRFYNT